MVEARIVTVLAALAVVLTLWIVRLFNRLIAARNACASARSSIDVQLVKRHDLIPNVARVVSGYAGREQATLTAVAAARSTAIAALPSYRNRFEPSLLEQAASETQIDGFIADVRACLGVVEALDLNTRIWSKS